MAAGGDWRWQAGRGGGPWRSGRCWRATRKPRPSWSKYRSAAAASLGSPAMSGWPRGTERKQWCGAGLLVAEEKRQRGFGRRRHGTWHAAERREREQRPGGAASGALRREDGELGAAGAPRGPAGSRRSRGTAALAPRFPVKKKKRTRGELARKRERKKGKEQGRKGAGHGLLALVAGEE